VRIEQPQPRTTQLQARIEQPQPRTTPPQAGTKQPRPRTTQRQAATKRDGASAETPRRSDRLVHQPALCFAATTPRRGLDDELHPASDGAMVRSASHLP
jgi:hypothetical protein